MKLLEILIVLKTGVKIKHLCTGVHLDTELIFLVCPEEGKKYSFKLDEVEELHFLSVVIYDEVS